MIGFIHVLLLSFREHLRHISISLAGRSWEKAFE